MFGSVTSIYTVTVDVFVNQPGRHHLAGSFWLPYLLKKNIQDCDFSPRNMAMLGYDTNRNWSMNSVITDEGGEP